MEKFRIRKKDSIRRAIAVVSVATLCMSAGAAALEPPPMSPPMPWTEGIMNTEEENSVGYGMATLDKEPVPVVYYNQKDPQYGKLPFGTDIIETHGCGPTAMAMVVSSLTDRPMDPGQMSQWAYENGYWKKGKGALHDLIPAAAQAWGLDVAGYQAKDAGQVLAALEQKKLVVVLMWPGHFTASGHFIVLRGLDEDGKVVVADPSSQKRSEVSWDFQLIVDEAAEKAGANGPFWVIG